jgi:alpha-tubulin suppressor-like RCC1 family protein
MYWEDPPEGPFVQIGGGEYGTMCGVRVDGSIACWGLDELGEVSEAPVEGVYTYVSGGAASFCAVAVDGSLSCWGDCLGGVCEPPAGTFVSVSVGYDHACALTPEGEAVCWGTDTYGETVPP